MGRKLALKLLGRCWGSGERGLLPSQGKLLAVGHLKVAVLPVRKTVFSLLIG